MLSIRGLAKPQYFWRPAQLIRRIAHEFRPVKPRETVQLPWKLSIEVSTTDAIGMALAQQGLYDVITTELVWRLTGPGETALDVGANIGYFTSLLAVRSGTGGAIYAWEPHPRTFQELQKNVEGWRAQRDIARIELKQAALSNQEGKARLTIPRGEETNLGYSRISSRLDGNGLTVRTNRLAPILDSIGPVGVMKLDVEEHEMQVLEGAGEHLQSGMIRDIIFEELAPFPAQSHKILIDAGYRIFWLEEHLRGLKIVPPASRIRVREYDLPPSFVATRDPDRLRRIFSSAGWKSF